MALPWYRLSPAPIIEVLVARRATPIISREAHWLTLASPRWPVASTRAGRGRGWLPPWRPWGSLTCLARFWASQGGS